MLQIGVGGGRVEGDVTGLAVSRRRYTCLLSMDASPEEFGVDESELAYTHFLSLIFADDSERSQPINRFSSYTFICVKLIE